jgi:ABC-type transport system involved in multi-copper enzyme maturation permease subunit
MTPIFSIARNAFLEAIRQPIFIVLVLIGLLAMVCNVNLAAFTMGEYEKLLVDLGLSTLFLVGLLLAAFTALKSCSLIAASCAARTIDQVKRIRMGIHLFFMVSSMNVIRLCF